MRVLLIAMLLVGCRERDVPLDARGPSIVAPNAQTRILYPSAPGSFVDLVASARHGVVGIRAAAPVKSGPAAMFPGAPEQLADVALGTGFLIEARSRTAVDRRPAPARLAARRLGRSASR
jgi:hypothetical protein